MGQKYRRLTDDALAKIAKKYKTRREFYDNDPSAFVTAYRREILDEICAHMFTGRFKWTRQMILNEAKKYKTRTEFSDKARSAYSAAIRQNMLEEACAHMPRRVRTRPPKKPQMDWTQEPMMGWNRYRATTDRGEYVIDKEDTRSFSVEFLMVDTPDLKGSQHVGEATTVAGAKKVAQEHWNALG